MTLSPDRFTFITYNVGLLRLRVCGMTAFSNPPYSTQRLPHLAAALKTHQADVLALQECYENQHWEYLVEQLSDIYPYQARVDSGTATKFHNGLAVFSKHKIVHVFLQPYDQVSSLERYMATKSNLVVDIQLDDDTVWRLVNMHTTAGGAIDPEHPGSDADRQAELQQAVESAAVSQDSKHSVGIILGDLNCGPEASPDNFDYILQAGYRDTYTEIQQEADTDSFTWDPKNYLNAIGPHNHCPGQRCDHVLLLKQGMEDWSVSQANIILRDAQVDLGPNKPKSTLSDHYGLLVEIVKSITKK